MCLAYPMKILKINGTRAVAEAEGIKREVGIELLSDAHVGEYVMIHAGYAIEKVKEHDAKETLKVFAEYRDALKRSFKK